MFLSASCKKKREIPSNKADYIGTWLSTEGTNAIEILEDGTAKYTKVKPSGASSYVSCKIFFTESGFYIKRFTYKRVFTVDEAPKTNPYASSFSKIATFNGVIYFGN